MICVSLYGGYVVCYTVNIALVTVYNRSVTVAYVTCYKASWILLPLPHCDCRKVVSNGNEILFVLHVSRFP